MPTNKKTGTFRPIRPPRPKDSRNVIDVPDFSIDELDTGSMIDGAKRSGKITTPPPPATAKVKGEKLALEVESDEELNELKQKFEAKKKRNTERQDLAEDASFWVGLVFSTTADANKFVALLQKLAPLTVHGQFMDGYKVCKALGLPVSPTPLPEPRVNVMQYWADFALAPTEPPPDARDRIPTMPVDA